MTVRTAAMATLTAALMGADTATPQQAPPLTLERLETIALANNPTLRQASAEIEASRGRARQAGAFPNPVAGYTGEEISPGPVIRGGEHGFFVAQEIPLGGKLGRSREVFEQEALEAEALVELQRRRILTTVRVLFYQTLVAERRVAVNERLAQLAAEAVTVTAQLVNVGAADRPDALESEVEALRASLDLESARNRRFASWRQLAVAVGDPTLEPQLLAPNLETAIPELERAVALRDLMERSPELLAARARVERSRAAVSRAKRQTFPDLFLRGGLAYNRELLEVSGTSPAPVGWEAALEAGISIPLFDRNQGGVAAGVAEQSRAELEVRRIELALESRFSEVFGRYLTALRSSETYQTEILPRAEEAHRLYLARYREMAASYPQVLIAQRSLFQLSGEYLEALDAAWRAALAVQGLLASDGLAPPTRPGESEPEPTGMDIDVPSTR
jgi:cobalt-zinc-cadmium efflux system outer membrane protein